MFAIPVNGGQALLHPTESDTVSRTADFSPSLSSSSCSSSTISPSSSSCACSSATISPSIYSLSSCSSSQSSSTLYSPCISPAEDYKETPCTMLKIALSPPPPTAATSPANHFPPPPIQFHNKRPKLSLQTSCVPLTFGKSTTALSLPSSPAHIQSPTTSNTFKNAYEANHHRDHSISKLSSPRASSNPSRRRACSSTHTNPQTELPYKLPKGLRSILRNSPIPRSAVEQDNLFQLSLGIQAETPISVNCPRSSSAHPGQRILTPALKRVNYRYPLDEEIVTVKFTAKHSDLDAPSSFQAVSKSVIRFYTSSDSDSDSYGSISDGSVLSDDEEGQQLPKGSISKAQPSVSQTPTRTKRKSYCSKRQIRAAGLRDGLIRPRDHNESTVPRTPSSRRRKVPRQWRWTLGPIRDGYVQGASPPSSSDSTPPQIGSPGHGTSITQAPSTLYQYKPTALDIIQVASGLPLPPSQPPSTCCSPIGAHSLLD